MILFSHHICANILGIILSYKIKGVCFMKKKNLFTLTTGVAMSFAISASPVSAQAEAAVKVTD